MKENFLIDRKPELLKEWDYKKNKKLGFNPDEITYGSGKKVWWKCENEQCMHEWRAAVKDRVRATGCPGCSRNVCTSKNSLLNLKPKQAKQFDKIKNKGISIDNISANSNKKVWWICLKGHSWESSPNARKTDRCPFCTNNRVDGTNSLLKLRPDLASEFSSKNCVNSLEIPCGGKKKYLWECKVCKNEWEVSVGCRVQRSSGCPKCNEKRHTSIREKSIFFYVEKIFCKAKSRKKIKTSIDDTIKEVECDIFIPEINVGIEYDGYWHKDRLEKDLKKNDLLKNKINLIRMREENLEKIEDSDIKIFENIKNTFEGLDKSILELLYFLSEEYNLTEVQREKIFKIKINCKKDIIEIKSLIEQGEVEESLEVNFPEIAKEFDCVRNGKLNTKSLSCGSNIKVWWRCSKNSNHQWEATVAHRTDKKNPTGCPYCVGQKANNENSIAGKRSDLLKEWDYEKNKKNGFNPDEITCGSGKKVWWKCKNGQCMNEWKAAVKDRVRGTKCPKCKNENLKRKVICVTTNEKFNSLNEAKLKYPSAKSISDCCAKRCHTSGISLETGERLKWEYYH